MHDFKSLDRARATRFERRFRKTGCLRRKFSPDEWVLVQSLIAKFVMKPDPPMTRTLASDPDGPTSPLCKDGWPRLFCSGTASARSISAGSVVSMLSSAPTEGYTEEGWPERFLLAQSRGAVSPDKPRGAVTPDKRAQQVVPIETPGKSDGPLRVASNVPTPNSSRRLRRTLANSSRKGKVGKSATHPCANCVVQKVVKSCTTEANPRFEVCGIFKVGDVSKKAHIHTFVKARYGANFEKFGKMLVLHCESTKVTRAQAIAYAPTLK